MKALTQYILKSWVMVVKERKKKRNVITGEEV